MFFYSEQGEQVQAQTGATDPHFYSTSLLLKMDSDFSDSSINNHTVTANGDATISSTESKYGGASGEFDGSGDYLTVGTSADCDTGGAFAMSEQFTVEMWINFSNVNGEQQIIENYNGASGPGWTIFKAGDSRGIALYVAGVGSIDTGVQPQANTWHHLSFCRDGTNGYIFLDGNLIGSLASFGTSEYFQNQQPLHIARRNPADGRDFWANAYIDDVRITKGVARYTANFTPPTEAHPTTGPESKVLHYDVSDTNSYPGTGNVLNDLIGSTDGNMTSVTYSTDGGGSLVFGAGSIVDIPSSLDVLSGDFTISSWYKNTGGGGFKVLFETEGYRTGTDGLSMYLQGDKFNIYKKTGGGFTSMIMTAAGTAGLNVWKNVTLKREDSVISLYIDGVQAGSTYTTSQDFSDTNYNLGGTAYPFNGNIADLEIYDRTLTGSEIEQNYNVTKSRFGL